MAHENKQQGQQQQGQQQDQQESVQQQLKVDAGTTVTVVAAQKDA